MMHIPRRPLGHRTGPRTLGALGALLLLTSGCSSAGGDGKEGNGDGKPKPAPTRSTPFRAADLQPGTPLPLIGTTWEFTHAGDGTGDGPLPYDGTKARMVISEDLSVRGYNGCNNFTARVTFPKLTPAQKALFAGGASNPIAFRDYTVDRKSSCQRELANVQEGMLKGRLELPGLTYSQSPYDESLTLSNGDWRDSLNLNARATPLTPAELGPLTGTKWHPDKPNWQVGEDMDPYFWIEEDGTVRGHTGCRRFTARAEIDTAGKRLTFSGPETQGPRSCDDEERTYEKAFLAKFSDTWKYEQSFHQVRMRRESDGKLFFAYTPGPPQTTKPPATPTSPPDKWQDDHELTGPRWTVDPLPPKPGSDGERIRLGPGAYLRIDEQGYAIGHTGCETFAARTAVSEGKVVVSHVAEVTVNDTSCTEHDRTAGREFLIRFAAGFRYARDASGTGWKADPLNGTPGFTLTAP